MKAIIVAGALCAGLLAANARAAEDQSGEKHMCVRLSTIIDSRVIDEQTILLNQGGGHYTRVDLTAPCPGLSVGGRGFRHTTSLTDEFCTVDQIRTNEPAGPSCIIKQMVSINATEAKALEAKK